MTPAGADPEQRQPPDGLAGEGTAEGTGGERGESERYGILRLRRTRKPDGRSLIYFERNVEGER